MAPLDMDPHFRPQTLLCELDTFPYTELVDISNTSQLEAASLRMGLAKSFSVVCVMCSRLVGPPFMSFLFPCSTRMQAVATTQRLTWMGGRTTSSHALLTPSAWQRSRELLQHMLASTPHIHTQIIYGTDAHLMGVTFAAAYESCSRLGLTRVRQVRAILHLSHRVIQAPQMNDRVLTTDMQKRVIIDFHNQAASHR